MNTCLLLLSAAAGAVPILVFHNLFAARSISPAEFLGAIQAEVPLPRGLRDAHAGVRGVLTHSGYGLAGEFPAQQIRPYLRELRRRGWDVGRRSRAARWTTPDPDRIPGLDTLPRRQRQFDTRDVVAIAKASHSYDVPYEFDTLTILIVWPPGSATASVQIGVDVE
ncbi:MAG: hypothetical protein HYU66_04600 [Armatimonadetes bacterium]|nr:hypothetical protein [Armatimonadota bacterium]